MANLQKTRTLFAFTSPRTVEKIVPEIKLLADNFGGKVWNESTQIDFFRDLFESDFYDGNTMPDNVPLAARDRITRAPKALGFVDLKPTIQLTEAGAKLVSGKLLHETITRQLLKFQLPSPYHKTTEDFYVKPYLEFLRLTKRVGSLSKTEVALFFTQLTHINKFEDVVQMIEEFRADAKEFKGSRKTYVDACFTKQVLKIYADDIEKADFKTRESSDLSLQKFVKTKKSNLSDYADAFLRYVRATQLITFEGKSFRAVIAPSKTEDVDFILKNTIRNPTVFKTEKDFKAYLFAIDNIRLLTDNRDLLVQKLQKLKLTFSKELDIEGLKDILEAGEESTKQEKLAETAKRLKDYKEFEDIIEVFKQISKREVPDPPLYLEWNIWRALVMLNYAKAINGNFSIDLDGVPLNTARGNMPDIEAEYEDFRLIVEVTTSTGNKQYEMEGEPVARHFGDLQLKSDKPVYCLFIASKISEGSLAHFFNLNKMNTKRYGGKTRIIPINQERFIDFVTVAKNQNFNDSKRLKSYFDTLIEQNFVVEDESVWFQNIEQSVTKWLY
ncbi:MAG: AlwI family type II restriction endonuclease [Saprospiraceae bacterium]|nr:AlwI family type II restriction endonuclease [Saprospiraceae bacterium]